MSTTKSPNTRYLSRFNGYYAEDCLCCYCLFSNGVKQGCSLDACMCIEEKQDAFVTGRIKRKRGNMTWDK